MSLTAKPVDVLRRILDAADRGDWLTIAGLLDHDAQLLVDDQPPGAWHGPDGVAEVVRTWQRHYRLLGLRVLDVLPALASCVATARCRATVASVEGGVTTTVPVTVDLDVHEGRIVDIHLATGESQIPPFH